MIVCDASALIAWLDSTDAHHDEATTELERLAGEELGTSTLTLAEVLVGPERSGRGDAVATALRALGVREIGLEGHARELAALRAATGLRLPDCCVVLAAQLSEGAPVLTFDEPQARGARSVGLKVLPEV